jgi:hypothetical protein
LDGLGPALGGADGLGGPGGKVGGDRLEAERAQYVQREAQSALDFGFNLFRRAEDVGIVLGEAAHAQQAVEHAGFFIAISRSVWLSIRLTWHSIISQAIMICSTSESDSFNRLSNNSAGYGFSIIVLSPDITSHSNNLMASLGDA